jgi:hypothetical protein
LQGFLLVVVPGIIPGTSGGLLGGASLSPEFDRLLDQAAGERLIGFLDGGIPRR